MSEVTDQDTVEITVVESLQIAAAAVQEKAEKMPTRDASPLLCSQCIGPRPEQGGFLITCPDGVKLMLCGMRCMALWAIQRGWKR